MFLGVFWEDNSKWFATFSSSASNYWRWRHRHEYWWCAIPVTCYWWIYVRYVYL